VLSLRSRVGPDSLPPPLVILATFHSSINWHFSVNFSRQYLPPH